MIINVKGHLIETKHITNITKIEKFVGGEFYFTIYFYNKKRPIEIWIRREEDPNIYLPDILVVVKKPAKLKEEAKKVRDFIVKHMESNNEIPSI